MSEDIDGLIIAYVFSKQGNAIKLNTWQEVNNWTPEQGILWVHLNYSLADSQAWLKNNSQLPCYVISQLIAEDTRSHTFTTPNGLFVSLRSVNLNPGEEPEDLVGLRVWLEHSRVISTRNRKVVVLSDVIDAIERNSLPATIGEFLTKIIAAVNHRMEEVVIAIDDVIDKLEENMIADTEYYHLRSEISKIRRNIIGLRRFLSPQRETLARLQFDTAPWLNEHDIQILREIGNQTTRYVEDLDAARDRVTVLEDEITNKIAEKMNTNLYVLTIVASLFLPINTVTSLFGINTGGIPLNQNHLGFLWVTLGLIFVLLLEYWYFKKKKWI